MAQALTIVDGLDDLNDDEVLAGLGSTVEESKANTYRFMQFSGRDGKFLVNTDAGDPDEISAGTEMMFSIFGSHKSWICWKDDEPVDFTEQTPLWQNLPPEDSLPDHGPYEGKRDGWTRQFSLLLFDPATESQYLLKLSNISSQKAVGALIDEVQKQGKLHGIRQKSPVVKLGVKKFKAGGYTNYKPDFEILRWADNPAPPVAVPAPKVAAAQIEDQSAAISEDVLPARKRG